MLDFKSNTKYKICKIKGHNSLNYLVPLGWEKITSMGHFLRHYLCVQERHKIFENKNEKICVNLNVIAMSAYIFKRILFLTFHLLFSCSGCDLKKITPMITKL